MRVETLRTHGSKDLGLNLEDKETKKKAKKRAKAEAEASEKVSSK